MARTTHVLYLHGFRSGPRSAKALTLQRWLQALRPAPQWACPQLPPSPRAAIGQVLHLVRDWPAATSAVVGSSLGGFYATVLAERLGWRALLLNPAVDPARDLAAHVGPQTAWHDPAQRFVFEPGFVDALRAMAPPAITRPARYTLLAAQGDELLDWREMVERYAGATQRILPGGDHALSDFAAERAFVLRALGFDAAGPDPADPVPPTREPA